ncbi:peptidylprolyl isomerase [Paenibacillus illinoisensis]|uniref:foldase protein PrsA n=1 Tax=Paenibacillus illinoisensis TaxID=59845 RepID=UPI001C8F1747|nr:peptidylprolyl isomerase [Paenibacillus illinoisensis]MBY0215582.1 peptidylprolyl isomerase [Paenibacillus illinoisensis]
MDNNKPSQPDNEEEVKDSLTAERETEQETTILPEMQEEENQQHPSEVQPQVVKGKKSVVWMAISGVLAAALIVVLVYPPFGGGRESVASVNGSDISKDELYNELVSLGGESTLNSMITMKLIDQEAAKANVSVTEQDVNAEIETLKTQYGGEEGLNTALSQSGMTMDSLKKNTEVQVKIRKILEPKTTVKDEDISAYYKENKATFSTPEQVRASHILVKTKEEADEIKKQLDEGADFATLAKEKSTDTGSAANGGDLGFFGEGEMVEAFEKAAFSMKNDEISEPIKSDYGYHIIKRTDYKEATNPTEEDKKEDIRNILVDQQVGELSTNWLSELRSKAKIVNTLEPADESSDAAAASTTDTESSAKE